MKIDMKVAVLAVAGLAAAGIGGSYLVGRSIEERLRAESARWQQALPFVKVLDEQYDRGVFGATHSARVQIGCDAAAAGGAGPLVLRVRDRIAHGPLPGLRSLGAAGIDTEITLDDAQREAFQKAFGSEIAPITLHTAVGFGGALRTEYELPRLSLTLSPQQQLSYEGVKGFVETDGRRVRYEGTMPGFEMKDAASGTVLTMAGVTSRGEGEPMGELAWLLGGKGSGEVARMDIRVEPPGGKVPMLVSLVDMKSSTETTVAGELMGTKALFSGAGDVAGVKVERFEAQVSMQRLHMASYEKLLGQMVGQALGAATCGPAAAPDREAALEMTMGALQAAAAALLPHDPVYSLDHLKATIAGKEGSIAYSLGSQGITADDLSGGNVGAMFGKLVVKADASIPVAWIETVLAANASRSDPKAPPMPPGALDPVIDSVARQGLVRREGDMLRAGFELAKGTLLLNGQPMPLPLGGLGGLGGGAADKAAPLQEAPEDPATDAEESAAEPTSR